MPILILLIFFNIKQQIKTFSMSLINFQIILLGQRAQTISLNLYKWPKFENKYLQFQLLHAKYDIKINSYIY